jgi:class 3 adenylate cyclase
MRVVKNQSQKNTPSKWNTPLSNYACALRPVAAIMVTKIVGFSALAENDQAASLLLLTKSYKLQEYYANQFGCTRMVKMGEMVLTAFNSVDMAVHCALKIERSARKMFNHKLRIGIHMGEVRYVDGDLFGGPVNIAQDILNAARPGEVLLSESAARCIGGLNYQVEARGTSGPMAVSTFKVKLTTDQQVFHIWNYQGKSPANHFEPGKEIQKVS